MLTREPVVQIHASRFCNYKCLHCYSSSSPNARDSLSVDAILSMTQRLADEGYRRASLSGGEPVLYKDFERLAEGLSVQGYNTSVITNGTHEDRLLRAMRAGYVQHASVSFDGYQALHDTVRQKKGAFKRAVQALTKLLKEGHSTGVVVSVTRQSLRLLPDLVADFADQGLQHIQLHPLAAVGRAAKTETAIGPELSQEALLRLILMTLLMRKMHPDIVVHCDAIISNSLKSNFDEIDGEMVSPIVIRDDGWLMPYSYDVSKDFALGHVDWEPLNCRVDKRIGQILSRALEVSLSHFATTFYREIVRASKDSKSCKGAVE